MNNSVQRFILIFAIFNFSSVMSDSNKNLCQEKSGPTYFFYKLNFLEGNYELANFIIRGVLLTMMTLFGLVANTLSIIVFRRPGMKSTINRILIGKIQNTLTYINYNRCQAQRRASVSKRVEVLLILLFILQGAGAVRF